MDNATIYDKGYYDLAMELAAKNNIPVQTKTVIAGGFIESRPEQRFDERTEGNLIRTADPLPFRTSGEGVFAVGKEILFCNISQIADI